MQTPLLLIFLIVLLKRIANFDVSTTKAKQHFALKIIMQENTISNTQSIQQLTKKKPLIIAGPCSAETKAQVLETAAQLVKTGKVDIFRAGIWKPRTRPGNFEGVGEVGLEWLQEIKALYQLPSIIEVANAKQVELALQYNIDALWIGARTTVNPFSVQEIADALKGSALPVYIKNPINPDIELWTGAIERIQNVGIRDIGLIHRGFSSYGNASLRNVPMWHLAIEIKRRFLELPILIDPSHITGNRSLVPEILQKAIDLDYDGAMIEAHCDPTAAWSDAGQQVAPDELLQIINNIIWRNDNIDEEKIIEQLEQLRAQIDRYDQQLLELIEKRMEVSKAIGKVKKENNVTILQTKRWNYIYDRIKAMAQELHLSEEFINHYMEAIHLESIRNQDIIMNPKD